MAAYTNGHAKGSNGHVVGQMNGKSSRKMATSKKRKQGFVGSIISMVARLSIWVAIFLVAFRCPSTLEECDETSPYICKPYFQTKQAIAPHVQPYYERYATPYIDAAQPYYSAVDRAVLSPASRYAVQYGAPVIQKGQQQIVEQWQKNGQPQLARVQAQTQAQYDKVVAPRLDQLSEAFGPYYEIARTNGNQILYEYLVPGYAVVQPYAAQGYVLASDLTTEKALPAVWWAWNNTYAFVDTTVWPQLRTVYLENVEPQLVRIGERLGRYKTRSTPPSGSDDSPMIHAVPSDAGKSSFVKPAPQSSSSSAAFSSTSTTSVGQATETPVAEPAIEMLGQPVEPPKPAKGESEQRKTAREVVAEDLEMWQKKFATQADEGAAAIEESITEISKRMIEKDAKVTGKDFVDKLESTIEAAVESIKTYTLSLVSDSDKSAADLEDGVIGKIRSVAMEIREEAQKIRQWRKSYDTELQDTVLKAADRHFKILDETRSLALQQIGMKWAWTDGITHKDWDKYHELKATLSEWTDQLKDIVVTYPALLEAQDAAAQVEDEAMDIASRAAKELTRLKEVAHYKLLAQDGTDSFELDAMKSAAELAHKAKQAEKAAEESAAAAASSASEAYEEAESTGAEYAESATSAVSDAASSVKTRVSEAATDASSAASETISAASEYIADKSSAASQSASSVLSAGQDMVSDASEAVSDAFDEAASTVSEVQHTVEEMMEEVTETITLAHPTDAERASESSATVVVDEEGAAKMQDNLAAAASEAILGETQTIVANATDVPPVPQDREHSFEDDDYYYEEERPSKEEEPVKASFFGAAAQSVSDRKPILDDYIDTDAFASATNAAEAAYSNALSMASDQYSSAVSVVSAQIYGTPKPVHEQLFASVSGAYDNAVSQASSRFSAAVSATSTVAAQATKVVDSMPTLVDWAKVESIASQRLNEGRLWAEIRYQSALIAMGLATPTPTSTSGKLYEQAKMNYFAGIGMAQDRYASFLAAASSAMSSITATPTPTDFSGTASSVASVAQASATSAMQAAEEAARSAYAAMTDSVAQAGDAWEESVNAAVDAAAEQYQAASKAFADTWDTVVGQISSQIYGEPAAIGWYDNAVSGVNAQATAASDSVAEGVSSAATAVSDSAATASAEALKQYSAVSELVSELISGKEPTFTESVLSRLGAAYATASANVESFASDASAAAASIGEKVGSAASQATEAVKETVQHAKDEL